MITRRAVCWLVSLVAFTVAFAARASAPTVVASFDSSFPSPDGLTWDGSFLWATDCSTDRIDKVDPTTGKVVSSIAVSGINSDELMFDGRWLWISDHTATEMPTHSAPPPRLYRVDPESGTILQTVEAPGTAKKKYPMGIAWDGASLWNIDTNDKKIHRLDPSTGAELGTIPSPASGACGIAWDGACLWVSDASTNGKIYHLDPRDGRVISAFDGPGGEGHQSTGLAWDGKYLWNHDEQVGKPQIFKMTLDDPRESGACAPSIVIPDAGTSEEAAPNGLTNEAETAGCGCGTGTSPKAFEWVVAAFMIGGTLVRRRRR